jgi:hypothetical protein
MALQEIANYGSWIVNCPSGRSYPRLRVGLQEAASRGDAPLVPAFKDGPGPMYGGFTAGEAMVGIETKQEGDRCSNG